MGLRQRARLSWAPVHCRNQITTIVGEASVNIPIFLATTTIIGENIHTIGTKKHGVPTNGCLSQKGSGGGSPAAAMATSVSCEARGGESLMAC
uniref:Uncharacterized protein n=1 Tax=Aegilops tauschii subsp. strangulata TaxID=200361 RepID=A0A453K825_AEGTS